MKFVTCSNLIVCPNCEALMGAGESCPECDYNDPTSVHDEGEPNAEDRTPETDATEDYTQVDPDFQV